MQLRSKTNEEGSTTQTTQCYCSNSNPGRLESSKNWTNTWVNNLGVMQKCKMWEGVKKKKKIQEKKMQINWTKADEQLQVNHIWKIKI